MLMRTNQGYFADGKPIAERLGEVEAQKLEQYLDQMPEFSNQAQALIKERSFDICVRRGVIALPPNFEDVDF